MKMRALSTYIFIFTLIFTLGCSWADVKSTEWSYYSDEVVGISFEYPSFFNKISITGKPDESSNDYMTKWVYTHKLYNLAICHLSPEEEGKHNRILWCGGSISLFRRDNNLSLEDSARKIFEWIIERADEFTLEYDTLKVQGKHVLSATLYAKKGDIGPQAWTCFFIQNDNTILRLEFPVRKNSWTDFEVTNEIVMKIVGSIYLRK